MYTTPQQEAYLNDYFNNMLAAEVKEKELLDPKKDHSLNAKFLIERGYAGDVSNPSHKTYTKIFDRFTLVFYRDCYVVAFKGKGSEKVHRSWGVEAKLINGGSFDVHISFDNQYEEGESAINIEVIEGCFEWLAKGLKSINIGEAKP